MNDGSQSEADAEPRTPLGKAYIKQAHAWRTNAQYVLGKSHPLYLLVVEMAIAVGSFVPGTEQPHAGNLKNLAQELLRNARESNPEIVGRIDKDSEASTILGIIQSAQFIVRKIEASLSPPPRRRKQHFDLEILPDKFKFVS